MKHARFVAKYANFQHLIQPEVVRLHNRDTGLSEREILQAEVIAKFKHSLVDDEAFAVGATQLVHTGLPEDTETGGNVSPRSRLAVLDTAYEAQHNGWSDTLCQKAIDTLRASDLNGIDFVEILPKPATLPWNGYDRTDPEKIVELALATATPLEQVIAYESENQARPEVLRALAAADLQDTVEDIAVVTA